MENGTHQWIFSCGWVRQSFRNAALFATILFFGRILWQKPESWLVLAPFAGWALVVICISLVALLKEANVR